MTSHKHIILFFVLTFVLLGLVPLSDLILTTGGESLDDIAARAEEKTGLVWTSNLLVVIRMAFAEPALIGLLIGSMVPALAAVCAMFFIKRPGKWRAFFGRLSPLHGTPLRSAFVSYALIFALLVPLLFVVLFVRQSTGGNYAGSLMGFSLSAFALVLTIAFLDQGAVLEELGWRGFASPELERFMDSPLRVAIIVGLVWGLWHVPRDVTTGVIEKARRGRLPRAISTRLFHGHHRGFGYCCLLYASAPW